MLLPCERHIKLMSGIELLLQQQRCQETGPDVDNKALRQGLVYICNQISPVSGALHDTIPHTAFRRLGFGRGVLMSGRFQSRDLWLGLLGQWRSPPRPKRT